jgi:hypothetical protein
MLEQLLRFAAIGTLAVGAVAAYLTVRHNTFQVGTQIFLAYSDRVRRIRRAAAIEPIDPEAIVDAMFLIFDFYELKRRRFLPKAVWKILDRDIADFVRSDHFRTQWDAEKVRFRNHPHFSRWVEAQLERAEAATGPSPSRTGAAMPHAGRFTETSHTTRP